MVAMQGFLLSKQQVITRTRLTPAIPPRVEYRLTDSGL